MPSKKVRRRRNKLKRHEYEYVVETDEGEEHIAAGGTEVAAVVAAAVVAAVIAAWELPAAAAFVSGMASVPGAGSDGGGAA